MYEFNVEDFMAEPGVFEGECNELACASLGDILGDMKNIKESYIKLGFHLDEFKRCRYYSEFGFESLEDFAQNKLGFDKSALSRCLNVFYEFSDFQGISRSMCVAEKWKDYSYSQLCEILPLNDTQRRLVTSDMTVKQIRELKKKNKDAISALKEIVVPSQPEKIRLCPNDLFYSGAVLQNKIKAAASLGGVVIHAFDKNGKLIRDFPFFNYWVELLMNREGKIVVRFDGYDVDTADD